LYDRRVVRQVARVVFLDTASILSIEEAITSIRARGWADRGSDTNSVTFTKSFSNQQSAMREIEALRRDARVAFVQDVAGEKVGVERIEYDDID
jgi:hypothetical protein